MSANSRDQATVDKDKPKPIHQLEQEQESGHHEALQIPSAEAANRMKHGPLEGLTPADALSLQRSVGNKAETKLLARRRREGEESIKGDELSSVGAVPSLQRHDEYLEFISNNTGLGLDNKDKIAGLEQAKESNGTNLNAFVDHVNNANQNYDQNFKDHFDRLNAVEARATDLESSQSSGTGGGDSEIVVPVKGGI